MSRSSLSPVLVAVPTYRERQNIVQLRQTLRALPISTDLLVIDDGSDDGTIESLQTLLADDPGVTVIERRRKLGLGTAYTTALAYARACGYERVVQMDADFSHDPADVVRLVSVCDRSEMVIGSRYVTGGGLSDDWPWHRRLLSRAANHLAALVLGLSVRDATGGFRCTRGTLLRRLPLERLLSTGFGWQWEFNRLVMAADGRIEEVPICFHQRAAGASKMSVGIVLEALLRIVQVRLTGATRRFDAVDKAAPIEPLPWLDRTPVTRRQAILVLAWIGAAAGLASQPSIAVGQGQPPSASTSGPIERAYVDRSSPHDPGTVVVVFHNRNDHALSVDSISINGDQLKDWAGPTDAAAWHRLTRDQLTPGGTGLLIAKLAQYTSGLVRVEAEANGRVHSRLVTAATPERVRVAALRYDPSGHGFNLFLENTGSKSEQVRSVELNEKEVWRSRQEGLPLDPGAVEAVRVHLERTLTTGERLQLLVRLGDRVIGVTGRAVPGFRISTEAGDRAMAQRIAADPLVLESFQFTQETIDHAGEAAPSLAERQGAHWSMVRVSHGKFLSKRQSDLACVFACPTHSTDCYQTSAYLAMTAQHEVDQRAGWQSFIHCCRTQPLRGLAIFGPIADAVRFNAALTTDVAADAPHRDKNPWTVYGLTRYAARAAAPSAAMPMIMLQSDWKVFPFGAPLAIEARQMVYSALAGGAGAMSYRIRQEKWGQENRELMLDEVESVNQEIRQVRDLLAMGYPRSIARCDRAAVQVACIDALPGGLVLIVINHDLERSPPEMPPSVQAVEQRDVVIEVELPDGVDRGVIRQIRGKGSEEITTVEWLPERLRIRLPALRDTAMLTIQPEAFLSPEASER